MFVVSCDVIEHLSPDFNEVLTSSTHKYVENRLLDQLSEK